MAVLLSNRVVADHGKVIIPDGMRRLDVFARGFYATGTTDVPIADADGVLLRSRLHVLVRDRQVVKNDQAAELADQFENILQDTSISTQTRRVLAEFIGAVFDD